MKKLLALTIVALVATQAMAAFDGTFETLSLGFIGDDDLATPIVGQDGWDDLNRLNTAATARKYGYVVDEVVDEMTGKKLKLNGLNTGMSKYVANDNSVGWIDDISLKANVAQFAVSINPQEFFVQLNGWNSYFALKIKNTGSAQILASDGLYYDAIVEVAGATGKVGWTLLQGETYDVRYTAIGGVAKLYIDGVLAATGTAVVNSLNKVNLRAQKTTAWVDDIVVPEPATMTLLGLGGLALIRRKR